MGTIYEEAIKEVKNTWNGNKLTYPKKTIEALERAKKVEELLGLYRLQKIEAQEKRLNGITLYWVYENKIKDLEKELF